MAGKIVGVFVSAQVIGSSSQIRDYLGISLAPQAGVALGMALVVNVHTQCAYVGVPGTS